MALSTDLIKEFVEITNDQTENKQETTVYGTIVLHGAQRYVQIDGSDLLTPVKATVDAIPGDRVTVLIKDHSVIVNGGLGDAAAARKSGLDAVNDHIDATFDATGRITNSKISVMETNINTVNSEITSINSEISALNSDVYIEDSETHIKSSRIEALETDVGLNKSSIEGINAHLLIQDGQITTIGSTVNTQQSAINTLDSTVTTQGSQITTINSVFTIENGVIKDIHGINANFADIEFADIDMASIRQLFANSGIIKDLTTETGSITGELVGVTIKGDMIEAGTLVADKLVIQGEDGLYYKLNTSGETVTTEQTEYNSLNGSVITAKSITAEKVSVSDLVAFGATIGGFHITENSIFSGAKSAIDNDNNGVYMDTEGQLYLGDVNNYIKYYKDSNDQYHLKISAEDLEFVNSTYFRLNNDGLLIGREDSPIQLLETNEKLSFKNVRTNEEYAYISSDGFNTSSLKIEDKVVDGVTTPGKAIFGGYEVSISNGVAWNWIGYGETESE